MKKIFFYLLVTINLLFSCTKKSDINEGHVQSIYSIMEYPDSSYFSDIRSISASNGKIYFLDVNRKDVAVFNENFDDFHLIGRAGQGYNELSVPWQCYASGDTLLILDSGSASIKKFNAKDGHFIDNFSIPGAVETPFFTYKQQFYIPNVTDSSTILIIPETSKENCSEIGCYNGKITKFDSRIQTRIRNNNMLLLGNDCFYAVSDNLPIIYKYDLLTCDILEAYDLSTVPIVKELLDYCESHPLQENSYYCLFASASSYDDSIYLLLSDYIPNYTCNTILKYSLKRKDNSYTIYYNSSLNI